MNEERTFVNLKHGKTRYILKGDLDNPNAPLILCIHGLGAGIFAFQYLANALALAGGFRVLLVDLYGSGFSDAAKASHDGDLYVDQLYELLEKLNLNAKVTLVAHSMGGAIATIFTSKYPERVEKLVLLSPAGMKWRIFGVFFLRWFARPCRWLLRKFLPIFFEKFLPLTFFDPEFSKEGLTLYRESIREAGLDKYSDTMFNKYQILKKLYSLFSIIDFPFTDCMKEAEIVSQLDIPVLVVWGMFDATVPAAICFPQWYEAFRNNPKALFYVIKDVRHDFMAEEVELCNQLILAFLKNSKPSKEDLAKFRKNANAAKKRLGIIDRRLRKFWEQDDYRPFVV
jgi:pimeloyl-ACP methyl ester carboxylesterase